MYVCDFFWSVRESSICFDHCAILRFSIVSIWCVLCLSLSVCICIGLSGVDSYEQQQQQFVDMLEINDKYHEMALGISTEVKCTE